MMIWKNKFLLFISFFPCFLFSQISYNATVYNNLFQNPESGVIITVLEGDKIITFTKTSSNGNFSISVENSINKKIVFRKLGFEVLELPLEILEEKIYLAVEKNKKEYLKEVVINAQKNYLRTRNDTTTFAADLLRLKTTTTVEDLIQNIPGVSVDKLTGAIRYQNREISNILIDGDDVTGKNYQIISKSLSEEAAAAIQIIEGYSENELLKNFEREDKVALNLKTDKKYRNKLKGSMEGGYGYKDRYDANVNLISISKKLKTINTASFNNTGNFSLGNIVSSKNLEPNEQPLLNINELNSVNINAFYNGNVRLGLFNTENILENNDFTISSNENFQFANGANLKTNVDYYKDNIESEATESFIPYDINDPQIVNNQEIINKKENFYSKLDFSKIYDDSKKIQFRTEFKNRDYNNFEVGIQNNNVFSINSEIQNPDVRFLVDYTQKLTPKTALVLFNNSAISKVKEEDFFFGNYDLSPLGLGQTDFVSQKINYEVFKNNFGINYAYKFYPNNILTSALLYSKYDLQNNISFFGKTVQEISSNSSFENSIFSPLVQWSYFSKNSNLSVLSKITFLKNEINNDSSKSILFTPSVNYNFKKTQRNFNHLEGRFSFDRALNFYDFYEINNIPLLKTNNHFYSNENRNIFYVSNGFGLNSNYSFQKIGLDINSRINLEFGKKPLIDNLTFFEDYYLNEVLDFQNDYRQTDLSFGLKKYFSTVYSNIEILSGYSFYEFNNFVNTQYLNNDLQSYKVRVNIGSAVSNSLQFSTGVQYRYSENKQDNALNVTRKNSASSIFGYFNANFSFLEEKMLLKLENEFIDYEITSGFLYSTFILQYKPDQSKWLFGLKVKNIFNHENFSSRVPTEFYFYEKSTSIIPRQSLLSLKYVF